MLNQIAMVLLFLIAGQAFGQTMVDLRTQSKSVDFSKIPSTRPTTVGASLPSTCQVGQMYFNSSATPGANLFGCTATNTWSLMSSSGTGGSGSGTGSGASMLSQLGDLASTVASGALTVGANCSGSTPCNVRLGNTVYSFKNPATVTPSGTASGLVFVYVDNSGNLTAGSTVTLQCSGCNYAPGVTSFPSDSIPVSNWTVNSGQFDGMTGNDFRAMISIKNLAAGPGILVSDNAGTSTVSVDPSLVSLHVLTPPATSSASCSTGQFSFDTNFYYICVAANTWKRFALSTF